MDKTEIRLELTIKITEKVLREQKGNDYIHATLKKPW
jgi:hypothetical protein